MAWDRAEGNWKQFTGKVKEEWGDLTDDEITEANGNREKLEGRIQERYGIEKAEARRQTDAWLGRQNF
ncbi:MAG: CsbD family protein [Citromicrobium sp.]|nr:MAG: CsbD family protein [Citromicrobium sp.]